MFIFLSLSKALLKVCTYKALISTLESTSACHIFNAWQPVNMSPCCLSKAAEVYLGVCVIDESLITYIFSNLNASHTATVLSAKTVNIYNYSS